MNRATVTDRSTLDEVWIPQVAARGWVILTRDSRIQDQPAELGAVRAYGARMVALASADAGTVWAQLEPPRCLGHRTTPARGSTAATG